MAKIAVVGIGRLGLCFALNLQEVGFDVLGVDSNAVYIDELRAKSLKSNEPHVEYYLSLSEYLEYTTELRAVLDPEIRFIFICVPTPSKQDGSFDHSHIDEICAALGNELRIVGNCISVNLHFFVQSITVPWHNGGIYHQVLFLLRFIESQQWITNLRTG